MIQIKNKDNNDDLVKAYPDRTFYENEQWKEDDAVEFASQLPPDPEDNISLFVTDGERAATARKKLRLSHKIFAESEFFGNLIGFFTIWTIFGDGARQPLGGYTPPKTRSCCGGCTHPPEIGYCGCCGEG